MDQQPSDVLVRQVIERRLDTMLQQLEINTRVPIRGPIQVYRRGADGEDHEVEDTRPPKLRAKENRDVVRDNRLDEIQFYMRGAIKRALQRIVSKYPSVNRSELLGAVRRSFPPDTGANAKPLFDRDLVRQAHAALMHEHPGSMDARSADAELAQRLGVSARTIQTYRLAAQE